MPIYKCTCPWPVASSFIENMRTGLLKICYRQWPILSRKANEDDVVGDASTTSNIIKIDKPFGIWDGKF